MLKKAVGVVAGASFEKYRILFDALAQLYPVEFCQVQDDVDEHLDGLIVLDGGLVAGLSAAARGVASFVTAQREFAAAKMSGSEVRFSESSNLDDYLRGQTMRDESLGGVAPLVPQSEDEVLAWVGAQPVWLNRPVSRGSCQVVAFEPPPIQPGEFLLACLSSPGFMRLLPLLNFLRQLVKDVDWHDAPTRACFVFDDPSLYRPTYGFLDFRRLVQHARQHDYCVSVAMVPLDVWWVNCRVAEIFRSSSPQLSLLVHGNDHTSHELLSHTKPVRQLALLAQAMRRMHRLEERYNTPFLRIMEPPHAAIAYEMFEVLLALGFEAALSTTEMLVRYNPNIPWPITVGMQRSELLGGGLPVIPRIRMSSNWRNEVLIAAFLRQPIVVAGHHVDAVNNLELLADFSRLIKGFKSVIWSSPSEMVRANYKLRRRGDVLEVKAFSRRLFVPIPEGIGSLSIHRPWLQGEAPDEAVIINVHGKEIFRGTGSRILGPIPFTARGIIEICCPPPKIIDWQTVKAPKSAFWPFMRRMLTEVRDRSTPWWYWASRNVPGQGAQRPSEKESWTSP